VYKIDVSLDEKSTFSVFHRYSEFRELYEYLKEVIVCGLLDWGACVGAGSAVGVRRDFLFFFVICCRPCARALPNRPSVLAIILADVMELTVCVCV
jgi:hypothetical protein